MVPPQLTRPDGAIPRAAPLPGTSPAENRKAPVPEDESDSRGTTPLGTPPPAPDFAPATGSGDGCAHLSPVTAGGRLDLLAPPAPRVRGFGLSSSRASSAVLLHRLAPTAGSLEEGGATYYSLSTRCYAIWQPRASGTLPAGGACRPVRTSQILSASVWGRQRTHPRTRLAANSEPSAPAGALPHRDRRPGRLLRRAGRPLLRRPTFRWTRPSRAAQGLRVQQLPRLGRGQNAGRARRVPPLEPLRFHRPAVDPRCTSASSIPSSSPRSCSSGRSTGRRWRRSSPSPSPEPGSTGSAGSWVTSGASRSPPASSASAPGPWSGAWPAASPSSKGCSTPGSPRRWPPLSSPCAARGPAGWPSRPSASP